MRVSLFVSSTILPFYLLMHRDMQQTLRVRASADFVASEIKSFRAGGIPGKIVELLPQQ